MLAFTSCCFMPDWFSFTSPLRSNQRSLFGFLNSAEPYGFQNFLSQASNSDLYTPDILWNYLRVNLEPSILASPDGHRWALATEVLERCESQGGEEIHIKLLKPLLF